MLTRQIDAEMRADLVEPSADCSGRDGEPDAQAGEAVGLGERPEPDDWCVPAIDRRKLPRPGEVRVGFVE
jgi:hypothetical protein